MNVRFPGLLLVLSATIVSAQQVSEPVDARLFQGLRYRLAGPYRGGRVTAVTGVPKQRHIFYMGTTGGGVWKTTDGGHNWTNISDGFFAVGSIGAVAVSLSNANIVYVGTGSACPRGNVSPGNGLYKSVDAGKTWKHMGLDLAGQIAKIQIHPADPDLVYAAVLGNVFGPNPERGIFRSRDGGVSWQQVLYINETLGAVDLALDPINPRILFAGLWHVERKPWTIIDAAKQGGVYKTTDGGDTWRRVGAGLPDESNWLGRVGIAISPADPQRIWVLQQATDEHGGGLYRSDNGGDNWRRINRQREFRQRQFYYTHVHADPVDRDRVYVQNTRFYKSVDGGKSFTTIRVPHGDNHDLWINPNNNQIIIQANDGGANISYDGGKNWSTQLNQPTAEIYRLEVDNQFPYRVYGAQQDNSTISLPSWSPGGIHPKQHWYSVGGGESGNIAVDPGNPDIIYGNTQIGILTRLDRGRGHQRNIMLYPEMFDGVAPKDAKYRVQWNAPLRISKHNPNVLYFSSQYVHRTTDEGQTWEVISPDLTTDNEAYQKHPGGPLQHENTSVEWYTTIFALEESPHQEGELWVGSDDGRLHITRDGGGKWQEITPAKMPVGGTVNQIDLSHHSPGRAFVAVYKYRENDFRPYIFRTNDFGDSWQLLTDGTNGIPADHFVRAVIEDPQRRGLIYAGTEFGIFVSFDDGAQWQPFQLNLPVTPITDLKIHNSDLIVSTQGRSIWILDDLTPLHQIAAGEITGSMLFRPRPAYRTQMRGYRGPNTPENPPRGALIWFTLDSDMAESIKIDIVDKKGRVVRSFANLPQEGQEDMSVKAGLNRVIWDLTYPRPDLIDGELMYFSYTGGPRAVPGTYEIRMTHGDNSQSEYLEVKADPRWSSSTADLQAQFDLQSEIGKLLGEAHDAIRTIRSVDDQIDGILARLKNHSQHEGIKSAADAITGELKGLENELIQTRNESHQDPVNFPLKLDNQISYLYSIVHDQDARPTQACYDRFEDLRAEFEAIEKRLESLLDSPLRQFEELLDSLGVLRIIVDR